MNFMYSCLRTSLTYRPVGCWLKWITKDQSTLPIKLVVGQNEFYGSMSKDQSTYHPVGCWTKPILRIQKDESTIPSSWLLDKTDFMDPSGPVHPTNQLVVGENRFYGSMFLDQSTVPSSWLLDKGFLLIHIHGPVYRTTSWLLEKMDFMDPCPWTSLHYHPIRCWTK